MAHTPEAGAGSGQSHVSDLYVTRRGLACT